jgi:hypothetical protein
LNSRLRQLGRIGWVAAACVGIDATCRGANQSFDLLDLLKSVQVAPNTRAVALRHGFLLDELQTAPEGAAPQPGDEETALIVLRSFDGSLKPTQWLTRLRLAAPDPKAAAAMKETDFTLYTNPGGSLTFQSAVMKMGLETLGPVLVSSPENLALEVQERSLFVKTAFLEVNLNRTADVLYRNHLHQENHPGTSYVLSAQNRPFSADQLKATEKNTAFLELSPADLRSFFGAAPALAQFLQIVQHIPELQNILLQVLDKPSIIDVFRHGASNAINFALEGGGSSLGQELFWPAGKKTEFSLLVFNLEIYGKPALTIACYVTSPRAPLEVSAGIVGIVAFSPSKPDKVVLVRVLASRPAGPANPAAP